MSLTSLDLFERAKAFRAVAEKLEQHAKRRAQIEAEEAEIMPWLQAIPSVTLPPSLPAGQSPNGDSAKTQVDLVAGILAEIGPSDRVAVFTRMKEMGRAPRDLSQMSALLNRAKSKAAITLAEDGLWRVAQAKTAEPSTNPTP